MDTSDLSESTFQNIKIDLVVHTLDIDKMDHEDQLNNQVDCYNENSEEEPTHLGSSTDSDCYETQEHMFEKSLVKQSEESIDAEPTKEKEDENAVGSLEDILLNDLMEDSQEFEDTVEIFEKPISSEFDVLSEIAEGLEFEQPCQDEKEGAFPENSIEIEALPIKRKSNPTGIYAEAVMNELKKDMIIYKPKKVKTKGRKRDQQMSIPSNSNKRLRKSCKSCSGCLAPECGECANCRDMKRFGGPDKKRQKCVQRQCVNSPNPRLPILVCNL